MKLFVKTTATAFIGLVAISSWASEEKKTPTRDIQTKVIYGDDNRRDLFEVTNSQHLDWAKSTLTVVNADRISSAHNQQLRLKLNHYGLSHNLCYSEPFWGQDYVGSCSAFLIAPDLVATAGHCVANEDICQRKTFVLDFALQSRSDKLDLVPSKKVFGCKRLITSEMTGNGADFAIVQLDRPITDRKPLPLRMNGLPKPGDPLLVIGNPMGLPTKVSDGASVRFVDREYLNANLDSYAGNSGSAVINASSGLVEGILVRGERDLNFENGCYVSNKCANDKCRGEDVSLSYRLLPHLR